MGSMVYRYCEFAKLGRSLLGGVPPTRVGGQILMES